VRYQQAAAAQIPLRCRARSQPWTWAGTLHTRCWLCATTSVLHEHRGSRSRRARRPEDGPTRCGNGDVFFCQGHQSPIGILLGSRGETGKRRRPEWVPRPVPALPSPGPTQKKKIIAAPISPECWLVRARGATPIHGGMDKLVQFGRKAWFVVRVMSGYEERRIRSYRLRLQKRLEMASFFSLFSFLFFLDDD
jgi:hypothetical protein